MINAKTTIFFLILFITMLFVSCGGQLSAAHSPAASNQQLDFESLGDDWENDERSAEDNELRLEDEAPTYTA